MTDIRPDIALVIDILFTGNLILFHLEYHWSPTLLFPSVGLRYLSHCRTPLPRCCMERVLIALVVAAICAVLYYVQLYWVSVMQCLLAFVLFSLSAMCPLSSFFNPVESGFNPTDLTIEPERRAVRCWRGILR